MTEIRNCYLNNKNIRKEKIKEKSFEMEKFGGPKNFKKIKFGDWGTSFN
jgi:hypothetical protein